ncbi:MAG: leucyl/phenylalanyl-tRNA--protein transferase [Pseudobdellovibrionaceae bacterium]
MSASLADMIYRCYREGQFPMADTRESQSLNLVTPHKRALLPITGLHIARSLKRAINTHHYSVTYDTAFKEVMAACAAPSGPERLETWINPAISAIFAEYHAKGLAHSIEVWEGPRLVGGLYGIEVGAVFCGESMFSRVTNASKIALVHLCARLWKGGFQLLDAQFMTDHLASLGAYEMPQKKYVAQLHELRDINCDFCLDESLTERELVSDFLNEHRRLRQQERHSPS